MEALTTAVTIRTAAQPVLATDLSGGLDSTPVAFLAARAVASRVARDLVILRRQAPTGSRSPRRGRNQPCIPLEASRLVAARRN
jgi:NH3-dependent NAD+ synthetase